MTNSERSELELLTFLPLITQFFFTVQFFPILKFIILDKHTGIHISPYRVGPQGDSKMCGTILCHSNPANLVSESFCPSGRF